MTKQLLAKLLMVALTAAIFFGCDNTSSPNREKELFTDEWRFHLGDVANAQQTNFNDSSWRVLDVPHDWSIEGEFSEEHPANVGGGALPGGIGWYRKNFQVNAEDTTQLHFIDFDGVYCNSEVWINGHYLGKRPNGYSSFRYELTPHLKVGENTLAVKVNNDQQPNSRWYSGSGIYRNVWLVKTNKIFVDHWGTHITTPQVSKDSASVALTTTIQNRKSSEAQVVIKNQVLDAKGSVVTENTKEVKLEKGANELQASLSIQSPELWSIETPTLYKVVTTISLNGTIIDTYQTPLGLRYFSFEKDKGFFLNGKSVKIKGVCNHHDLGALGAALNVRAKERQLEIMKEMGVNGIRTAHNPPAPELLQLCDSMGFIVMDEAFDMWAKKKMEFDYSHDWEEWHERDLQDLIKRDRNHPSVFIWSIGNEIYEQWDSTGTPMAKELAAIVEELDDTRPITSALNDPQPSNKIYQSGELDLVGFNYHHEDFEAFPENFPGEKFIATETTSALATRGHYDMPSDSIRRWPIKWDIPFNEGNPDHTVSAYDHVSTPWGSTHEETWKIVKKHDYLSGMYIWTGFDYLGEPTPYGWPSRSSYFGIVDLAGFPKDAYYMYKSEWTEDTVLHVFPHWNWEPEKVVDIWAYYNHADEVELFLNGESQGIRKKEGDDLHVMWRLTYQPGTVKVVSRKAGEIVSQKEIHTAGKPHKIVLEADREALAAGGRDLSFVTVKVLDKDGNLVPKADNLIQFSLKGNATIAGVDNGNQTSMESFKDTKRKAFNGLALAIVRSEDNAGETVLTATSEGLESAQVTIKSK